MTNTQIDVDVAIAGAGPVGVSLAALLGQAGISVFIGESATTVYPLPRAAHFDHEIMRIFQQLGIVDAIADSIVAGERYVFQNNAGDVLLDFDLTKPTESGWGSYMMHQPGIERALRARLEADPLVELETGVTFSNYADDDDHVVSQWEEADGPFSVRSRFLVGCDGSWSPVREAMDSKLEDLAFDEPWLVLDLLVEEQNGLPDHSIQYCDPDRPTTYVVMGNRRRRFEFMLKPGEQADAMMSDEEIRKLLAPWNTGALIAIERRAVYRFHALVAERWRQGRVLIAGDAAHQMPPFAGQGMCSGIRDAAALAWRLPLALHSDNPTHLLDSYQSERDPHVRAITAAAVETGRVVCTLDPTVAAGRDAAMLASRAADEAMPEIGSPPLKVTFGLPDSPRAGERFIQPGGDMVISEIRMDDVLGVGAWLITAEGEPLPAAENSLGIRVFAVSDEVLAPFRSSIEAWLAAAGSSAVLVRADRYVFGTGTAAVLLDAYGAQAGLPVTSAIKELAS